MTDDLGPLLPAIIDNLDRAGIGVALFRLSADKFVKLFMNAAGLTNFGYTQDEWLALPIFEMVAPDQRSNVSQLFESLSSNGPVPPAVEITFVHKLGHPVRLELTCGRVVLPSGFGLSMMFRELGPHEQTQLSLLEADRISLVGALAAGFAHEINNPLTSVLLNVRSLRKQLVVNLGDVAQIPALRCLDDITTGAERIASNVRALQTLATRSSTQPIDLAAVVSSALRLAAPTLEPRAHVVRQIFPVRAVAGEESRIGQAVLAMMLFSASGFTTGSTTNRIVVAVEERDGCAIVEVSDNGHAVGEAEVTRAFDPFYRSPARGAGVGVGLGVARSVASTLGGDVTLAPRPGGGAVITLRLPQVPA